MIRRFRKEAEEIKALDMEVSDIVDLAVDALEERGVMEIDYQEGEEPAENEAIFNQPGGKPGSRTGKTGNAGGCGGRTGSCIPAGWLYGSCR